MSPARARLDRPPAVVQQSNFAAGMFDSVAPHLIPRNGARDIVNMLTDQDGSLYKRGGSAYYSPVAVLGAALLIWDGTLLGGQRTVFATYQALATFSDDLLSISSAGGLGLIPQIRPGRAVELNGILFLPGGAIYAGSRQVLYSAGTVSLTNGSKTVTGSGTSWTANVDPGKFLRVAGGRAYAIASVESNTSLTLRHPYQGPTLGGQAYTTAMVSSVIPGGLAASLYAVAGGRLVAMIGNRAYMSSPDDPFSFNQAEEYHELPAGAVITGAETLGDTLFIFSTHGVWAVTNVNYDLTDAYGNQQQALEPVSRDLVLWDNAGIASWAGALIVPAIDGVWLLSGAGPTRLVRQEDGLDPIHRLYQKYVRAGYRAGGAVVYKDHYILPILTADSSTVIDTLVCRLTGGPAWTRMDGEGAAVSALAVRVGTTVRAPTLLGTQLDQVDAPGFASVMDCSGWFEPSAANASDLGRAGAPFDLFQCSLVMRDQGGGPPSMWKKIRVWYELADVAPAENPQMAVGYGTEKTALVEAYLSETGAATDGSVPYEAPLDVQARHLHPVIEEQLEAAKFVIRAVDLFVRPSGKM